MPFHRTWIFSLALVGSVQSATPTAAAWMPAAAAPEIVRVGQPLPRWDRIRPGTSRYLRFIERDGRRIAIDIWSRTVSFEPDPATGERRMRIVQSWNGARQPVERSLDSWFEIGTFRPLSHRTRREANGETSIAAFLFSPEGVRGDASVSGNAHAALAVPTPGGTFNFETDMELISALPWREGYAARVNFYHPSGGPPQDYVLRVIGSDAVRTGSGAIDCWVVLLDYGGGSVSRFWVDKATQTVIRVAATGPDVQGTLYKVLLPEEPAPLST